MWNRSRLRGSEAVFGVTDFWDPEIFLADPKGKQEITQGKNLVDAAKEFVVKVFIWRYAHSCFWSPNTMRLTYPKLSAAIAAELNKEVTFTSLETSGLVELDEMIGLYKDTPVLSPALVALGARFGWMKEFIKTEVVP
ncbi:hypothetical protein B0H17DRAFT_1209525 [Mycena rosella]|uniref:NmrA-like domain-containing protein n=1 Tax=Mycena rosella TaxID=1033263 RepID=A0AAD7CYA4_MYCRO|nr:hypothetical protein B0H17DRAFT_1209525 [Mycena rosella]